MALFDVSKLGNLFANKKPMAQVIPGTMTTDKMTWSNSSGDGSAYVVNADSLICSYVIPPQQFHYWGFGSASQPANQGYMFVSFKDTNATPVQIDGTMTLRVSDAVGRNNHFIVSYDTANLRGSTTLRTQQIPLPAQPQEVAHINDRLEIYLKVRTTTGTGIISKANSEFYIPESYGFE